MFADAAVYANVKLGAAHLSGWLQLALAAGVFAEVARRFVFGSDPEPPYMIAVVALALAANVACMYLIARHRKGALICAPAGSSPPTTSLQTCVIVAGALVAWTGSRLPDLVIGTVIAAVVLSGALRILRLR